MLLSVQPPAKTTQKSTQVWASFAHIMLLSPPPPLPDISWLVVSNFFILRRGPNFGTKLDFWAYNLIINSRIAHNKLIHCKYKISTVVMYKKVVSTLL